MATLLYNSRPSLRPSRTLSALLADMVGNPQAASGSTEATAFVPAADTLETAGGFELHLALPGVAKEAVTIDFLDGQLVIFGNRPRPVAAATDDTPAVPTFHRSETGYGDFVRRFRLPETVNVQAIGAELRDGILRVVLPFDTAKVTKQHIEIR